MSEPAACLEPDVYGGRMVAEEYVKSSEYKSETTQVKGYHLPWKSAFSTNLVGNQSHELKKHWQMT